jgi:hypothetical protein
VTRAAAALTDDPAAAATALRCAALYALTGAQCRAGDTFAAAATG